MSPDNMCQSKNNFVKVKLFVEYTVIFEVIYEKFRKWTRLPPETRFVNKKNWDEAQSPDWSGLIAK